MISDPKGEITANSSYNGLILYWRIVMLSILARALHPLEVIDLIAFHLKNKVEPALKSVVTSEIILFWTIAILAKSFINQKQIF